MLIFTSLVAVYNVFVIAKLKPIFKTKLSIHFIVFKSRIKLIHLKVEFYKILWVFNFIYTGIKQKLEKVFIVVERCKHKLHSFKLSWVVYFVF